MPTRSRGFSRWTVQCSKHDYAAWTPPDVHSLNCPTFRAWLRGLNASGHSVSELSNVQSVAMKPERLRTFGLRTVQCSERGYVAWTPPDVRSLNCPMFRAWLWSLNASGRSVAELCNVQSMVMQPERLRTFGRWNVRCSESGYAAWTPPDVRSLEYLMFREWLWSLNASGRSVSGLPNVQSVAMSPERLWPFGLTSFSIVLKAFW
jgi:hypothetical protein